MFIVDDMGTGVLIRDVAGPLGPATP
jgi:hypothetical protein